MQCPSLATPSSGTLDVSTNGSVSTAVYTCANGYNLVGDTIRICQDTGQWTGQDVKCCRYLKRTMSVSLEHLPTKISQLPHNKVKRGLSGAIVMMTIFGIIFNISIKSYIVGIYIYPISIDDLLLQISNCVVWQIKDLYLSCNTFYLLSRRPCFFIVLKT